MSSRSSSSQPSWVIGSEGQAAEPADYSYDRPGFDDFGFSLTNPATSALMFAAQQGSVRNLKRLLAVMGAA